MEVIVGFLEQEEDLALNRLAECAVERHDDGALVSRAYLGQWHFVACATDDQAKLLGKRIDAHFLRPNFEARCSEKRLCNLLLAIKERLRFSRHGIAERPPRLPDCVRPLGLV